MSKMLGARELSEGIFQKFQARGGHPPPFPLPVRKGDPITEASWASPETIKNAESRLTPLLKGILVCILTRCPNDGSVHTHIKV